MIHLGVDVKAFNEGHDSGVGLGLAPEKHGEVTREEFEIASLTTYLLHKVKEYLMSPKGTRTIVVDDMELAGVAHALAHQIGINVFELESGKPGKKLPGIEALC